MYIQRLNFVIQSYILFDGAFLKKVREQKGIPIFSLILLYISKYCVYSIYKPFYTYTSSKSTSCIACTIDIRLLCLYTCIY